MESEKRGQVAVIVVNYNTAALTIAAISSVVKWSSDGRVSRVYIVDNASPGDDVDVLTAAISAKGWNGLVELRKSPQNVGFGAGNNLVMADLASGGRHPEYVFLLNPDAELENDAIGILGDFLDTHEAAAAAGAGIVCVDGTPASAAFRFPGVISSFSSALSFGPVARALRQWEVPLPPSIPTRRVDWVSGAAVMLRLSNVERAGFFDPAYFLYFEEVDLMRQLARQGGEVWHVAEARVVHLEGAATGVRNRPRPSRLPEYWYRSWRHYHVKNHGCPRALMAGMAWYLGAGVNKLISLFRGKEPRAPDRFFGDFWRIVMRPLLGLRTHPHD
jgi:GT2 family glycosyltransferase